TDILTKIATPTAGAVLTLQQGDENSSAIKFAISDNSKAQKVVFSASGASIGTSSVIAPLTVDTSINHGISGATSVLITGDNNTERLEIRSSLQPAFIGRNSAGSVTSPLATTTGKILFTLAGGGYDGAAWTIANPAVLSMLAEETFTTTGHGTNMVFATTPQGSIARSERMRVAGNGNVGIGTPVPGQKLEVNGGIRLNTGTAKPTCDATTRGTLWFTQGATGVKDATEVCAKDASEAFAWRLLY